MQTNKRAHLLIDGKVQGVWFRGSTQLKAEALSVTGWVANRADGSVEAVIEGEAGAVEQLISWLHEGPRYARVDTVRFESQPYAGEFSGFSVRR